MLRELPSRTETTDRTIGKAWDDGREIPRLRLADITGRTVGMAQLIVTGGQVVPVEIGLERHPCVGHFGFVIRHSVAEAAHRQDKGRGHRVRASHGVTV